jgi:hypothetical protein
MELQRRARFGIRCRFAPTPVAMRAFFVPIVSLSVTSTQVRLRCVRANVLVWYLASLCVGVVTTISNASQPPSTPCSLLVLRDGSGILICDYNCHIRFLDTATNAVSIVAGSGTSENTDGDALSAGILHPESMAFDSRSAVPDSAVFIVANFSLRHLTLQLSMFSAFVC